MTWMVKSPWLVATFTLKLSGAVAFKDDGFIRRIRGLSSFGAAGALAAASFAGSAAFSAADGGAISLAASAAGFSASFVVRGCSEQPTESVRIAAVTATRIWNVEIR